MVRQRHEDDPTTPEDLSYFSMPAWVKAAMVWGPVAVIAFISVYALGIRNRDEQNERKGEHAQLSVQVSALHDQVRDLQQQMTIATTEMHRFAELSNGNEQRIITILRQLCLMQAREQGNRSATDICSAQ